MPKKLTDCVRDVKAQGRSDDSAWGICVDSTGEKPHHETKEESLYGRDLPAKWPSKKNNKIREKDYPWSKCIADQKKEYGSDATAKEVCGSIKAKYGETTKNKVREKVNANRQVPFFNPPIKVDPNKPQNRKTTKGMGGTRLNPESYLWKDIFDAQLKQNVKEPRI